MDRAALALGLISALSLVVAGGLWTAKQFMHTVRERLRNHGEDILELRRSSLTPTTLNRELEAVSRNAEARNKLFGCVLAERIDALSARLDAVELETGLREKPKTMGGK